MSAAALVARGRRRRRSAFGRLVYAVLALVLLIVLFAAGTVAGIISSYSRDLPDINRMADFQPERSTRVYARDGADPLRLTQSTVSLSGKELARNLGSSVAQTLSSEPGMAVRYNGPAATVPVIRGLSGERVLVLGGSR